MNFVSERSEGTTEDRGLTDATHMEEVDFIIPRSEIIRDRSMSYLSSLDPDIKLDNVWLTTVAGKSISSAMSRLYIYSLVPQENLPFLSKS